MDQHTTQCRIPPSALRDVFKGVVAASRAPEDYVEAVEKNFLSLYGDGQDAVYARLLPDWRLVVDLQLSPGGPREIAYLTLAVAFLRETGRPSRGVSEDELELTWSLIHSALTSPHLPHPLCTASRSAQGFLAVPLCSLLRDGAIDQLFRLHVWLPDGQRGNANFAIHSHQPFAQSWVLVGEGTDHRYDVEPSENEPARSTNAIYELAWSDGTEQNAAYKTHQTYSIVQNTGRLVRASLAATSTHHRGTTYTIPDGAFHSTSVAPDKLHATLFLFDARRGFTPHAPVLGPADAECFKQLRDPAGTTPMLLAETVQLLRTWEVLVERGRQHTKTAELEFGLVDLNDALGLCESNPAFPNAPLYRRRVLGELGSVNRRLGRYEKAREILEAAIAEAGPSLLRIEMTGELGVVYRHMNLLEDAKRAFEMQYRTAEELGSEQAMCRAIGNLGMINFQLSQQMLQLAVDQLNERVERARRIKGAPPRDGQRTTPNNRAAELSFAATQEAVGLARLSLCYSAQGNTKQAVTSALASLRLSSESESTRGDSTLAAFSRFFYGRALLLNGQRDAALAQFNPPPPACTPAMAMCKEPSDEHRQYLRELVDAGADMDLVDEQGYTALDHAVFSGNAAAEELVLEGLRRQFGAHPDGEGKVGRRRAEARIRKRYREMFQETMRPVLLRHRGTATAGEALRELRRVYAENLAVDDGDESMFDHLKVMRWPEFLGHGELPRSSDGLARPFDTGGVEISFVIFFSYRWINKDKTADTPDDADKTQYRRMKAAVEEFLALHPDVDGETLGIWVDHACVDQDDPMPGVNALPMIVAQCDALISLVDDAYYARAWCAVEVMMIEKLRRAYETHLWYEQVPSPRGEDEEGHVSEGGGDSGVEKTWCLREAPRAMEIVMAEKHLTFEEDRPKVLFLERQSKLL